MAEQVADLLPPKNGDFQFLLIDLRVQMWQIYSPQNGNFQFLLIDSYAESSDVAGQVADLPFP